MEVIKKDGSIQRFDEKKIQSSLFNAANDAKGANLNKSDIKILNSDVLKILKLIRKDCTPTSTYEIRGIMINTLKANKFINVLKAYIEFQDF